MNAPVLLYGERAPATVGLAAAPLDVSAQQALVLPAADILYVLFEMPMKAAVARLPVSLHPSVPAALGITFLHARSSPFGAFTLAYVGIACRTGIKPRHFITGAFCNNEAARTYLGNRYGFACLNATVDYRETYDRVRGAITQDGVILLDVAIVECQPLVGAGGMIKYSPPLTATRVNGAGVMVQFEAAYDFKRSVRGKARLAHYNAQALGDAAVAPVFPIAGSHAVCDVHLLPVRFAVDLEVPAEQGGARKLVRAS